jgi:hypothetical protein
MDTTITERFITLEMSDAHDNILITKQIPDMLVIKCLALWGFDPLSTGSNRIKIKAPNGSVLKTF